MTADVPHDGRLADGLPPATPDALFARLAQLGIAITTHHHPPVFTVEEARTVRGDIPGGRSKNLFVRNKKGTMWLFSGPADRDVDLRRVGDLIGARSRLSFGSGERLMKYLGVVAGAVSPFAIINDRQRKVQVVLDRELLRVEPLNFHPLDNTMTTSIAKADLLRFLRDEGHAPLVIDLP
jgi:Ala-tRNA(Pro) deacylase